MRMSALVWFSASSLCSLCLKSYSTYILTKVPTCPFRKAGIKDYGSLGRRGAGTIRLKTPDPMLLGHKNF